MTFHKKLLFLLVFISSAYFYQGPNPNVTSRFDLILAVAFEYSINIDSYAANTIDRSFRDGHFYSDKAPGLALPGAAILKLADPLLKWLSPDPYFVAQAQLFLLCLIFLSLFTAWTATLFYNLALERLENKQDAFLITAIVFCGTLTFAWSTALFSHQISANFLFVCFYYFLALRHGKILSKLTALSLAFASAYAVTVEYPLAVPMAAFYFYLTYKNWRVLKLHMLVPGFLVALGLAWYHQLAFGSPLLLGYNHLESYTFAKGMSEGFLGLRWPVGERLYGILFSSYRGLLYFSPIFCFAFIGLIFSLKNKASRYEGLVITLIFGYFLWLNSSYHFWFGGGSLGPRHLVPSLLILGFAFTYLPRTWSTHPSFYLFALLSWGLILVSTAVNLFPPETIMQTWEDAIWPFFSADQLSVYTWPILPGGFPDNEARAWSAFNWGEFLLPGKASLLPLLFFQLAILIAGLRGKNHEDDFILKS